MTDATEDFIRALQAEWRAQPVEAAAVVGRLRRGRWTPHLVVWLEVLQGVAAVAAGVGFAWLAIRADHLAAVFELFHPSLVSAPPERVDRLVGFSRPIFGLAAVAMLTAAPLLAGLAVRARLGSLRWEDETPESVLRVGLRRADASLRANRVGRWNVIFLAGFVAVFWIVALVNAVPVTVMAINTVMYAAVVTPAWIWLDLRRERVRRELETCMRLLQDYEAESGASQGESESSKN